MATATLQAIRDKTRRLTRSLSPAILSDNDLDQYINTFVLYDFPEHLRLFNLESTFEFYTQPYQDTYETNITNTADPLYDFKNKYISVHPPVYVAGFQSMFSESREQFFNIYPLLNSIQSIGSTGNGVTSVFNGTLPSSQGATSKTVLLKNNVLFSSIDSNSNALSMIDYPISPTIGNLYVPGGTPTSTTVQDPVNFINYVTGQFVVTFTNPPGSGEAINSQTVPVQPSRPQSMLFYDGKFTLRPVPDQSYKVQMNVFTKPTELLVSTQAPDLEEWWQYIAYGAAKKVFEDRMDLESVSLILPEFKKQEALINRRTIVQQTSQRTATIYTENNNNSAYGSGWFGGGGQF